MASTRTVSLPLSTLGARAHPPTIARLMTAVLEDPAILSLAAGFTDTRTLPLDAVKKAVDTWAARGGEPEFLQYGPNQGRAGLRQATAAHLQRLEPALEPEAARKGLFITNGSQQALYLAVQVLCDPGDIILVDRPSYFVFLEMLSGLGVRIRSLPLDDQGKFDAAEMRALLRELRSTGERARVKAVYLVSYFSNPSARSLDEADKVALAEVLAQEDFVVPVIEDAAYRELYFREPHPARSVLTLPAWREFPRLYLATFTKTFATGLKVGYGVCSDAVWLAKMLHLKGNQDFGTANFNQAIVEVALANGDYDRQLARTRAVYEVKMRALHETLVSAGVANAGWSWAVPTGGLYLWLAAPRSLSTGLDSAFCQHCVAEKVLYVPGELCFGDQAPQNYVRLSFGVLGENALGEAGQRFARAVKAFA